MGILEIHFHDSEFGFEWEFNPAADTSRGLPFTGDRESESEPTAADGGADAPSPASKLRSLGFMALVIGGTIAFNRIRSRRARKAAEAEGEAVGRRLSLSHWK
ncbi:hypothetical protein [Halorussus litoreus]|uniref:hypothetical protein n=1 Tax=Halorussus litoreus TaxID=1710536 RepID=UPI000E249647|nr:hypothetical protein [Halorussus litoreus]